jgi:hypothetical protein
MQCVYIYKEGVKKGERCGSNFACVDKNDSKYLHCFKHAQALGLVPKEELAAYEDKRSIAYKQLRDNTPPGQWGERVIAKKKLAKELLSEENRAKQIKIEAEEKKKTADLVHQILGDKDYDAKEMFEDLKDANADFKYTEDMKKFVFIGWYAADILTRKPGTLKELCEILGMRGIEGMDWISSDWFIAKLSETMKKTLRLAEPYLHRVNLAKALGGDFNAYKEYNRTVGKHEIKEGDADWDEELSDDIKQEAEEVMEIN